MKSVEVFAYLLARQPASLQHNMAGQWLQEIEAAVFSALREGAAQEAAETLATASRRWPDKARLLWLHALALREQQAHEAALVAGERAVALAGDDSQAHALLAQLRYETGRPAASSFAAARARAPDDVELIRGHAGALTAEGGGKEALALMEQALTVRPRWVEGLAYYATLRRLLGEEGRDDIGFAQAVRSEPHNLGLRLGWFHWLAKAKDWDAARVVIAEGDAPALEIARLYLAAESGEVADRPDLFDAVAARTDVGLALARVRHALRCGAPDLAAEIALAQIGTAAAPHFWPYLSICWRLLGDDRAEWLDRPGQLIRTAEIGLGCHDLSELTDLLRTLHGAAAPYPGQSVRGGTQTDRPLLFRHEPVMRRTRAAIEAAVRDYIAALPPFEVGHPLLGTLRGEVKFAGSWSVRLLAQGYHAAHTHPDGWISSALHISLPGPVELGSAPAGWLRFGAPPPELGIELPPYVEVKPQAGRLILFPSTLWHGTVPFNDGERLSIAFDIRPPRR